VKGGLKMQVPRAEEQCGVDYQPQASFDFFLRKKSNNSVGLLSSSEMIILLSPAVLQLKVRGVRLRRLSWWRYLVN
jgi:hypothetical protein